MDYIPAEAFDELWEKFNKRIYSYFRLQFDADTAEDLCQQTFMKVWQYLCSYCGKIHRPRAWIFAVAKNVRNDYLRTVQSKKGNYDYADLYTREIPVEYDFDEALSIQKALKELTEQERELLSVSQYLSSREVGSLYGISASAARSRLQKVRAKLRDYLAEGDVNV
ncbi:MAG: RNA polymerase sigma factor [Ruminococcaceae bacterium]|nr:RNA polymerase sigma factor [Oscillospiraceae bacterium]